jgi:glycosyltransferase involved in cell wall biosynthesis
MSASQPRHRICFVGTTLGRGGAEVHLFQAATGLQERGFDVHVVCMLPRDYWGEKLEERGIPVTYMNLSRTCRPLPILVRFLRCMAAIRPSAIAGFDYPGAMLARTGGTLARIPVVISSIHSENFGGWLRRLALVWTDSFATATTVVSQRMSQKLIALGAASARVHVIPNGTDMTAVGPHLRARRAALRQSLGIGDGEFLWLAAGRLEEPKDYPNLLEAMAMLRPAAPHARLAIAGQGPLEHELRALAASLHLDDVVSFLGFREDVHACMAAADATVLASAWEGLPNVVIESLAAGTPIVSTDVGGVREVIDEGVSGLIVPPRRPLALASAMSALMARSPSDLRSMGDAGRAYVETHYAVDNVVAGWSDLFNDLLGQPA